MRTESDFPYISTLGIIFMLPGAFVTASGIADGKFSFIAMGLVLFGFAIYLWIESDGIRVRNSIVAELPEDESEEKE